MANRVNRILIVVQPSANHYREPFLREIIDQADLSVELFGRYSARTQTPGASLPLRASREILGRINRIHAQKILGPLIWDRGLLGRVLRADADLYVLEGSVYNLTTWFLALLLKLRGEKVAFWGHGWKRPESGAKLTIRKIFYRLPDAHFVYGNWAKRYAASVGLPNRFFPIYNSFTSEKQLNRRTGGELGARDQNVREARLTLLFSGRLTQRHRVDLILRAVLELRLQEKISIKLLVVGDGPEYSTLLEMANADPAGVEFLGAVYSVDELRRVYNRADYAVSPGASGLNIIQALSFNVPVIAASGDPDSGPELEAVQHGKTGLLYPKQDIDVLKSLLLDTQTDAAKHEREMFVQQGFELVRNHYTAEQHASAFLDASLQIISDTER